MSNIIIISLLILTAIAALVIVFKQKIIALLVSFKNKLFIKSLRHAINDADADKDKTGRKNMIVWNTASQQFEPIQKKQLKKMATIKKQPSVQNGYRVPKAKKVTSLTTSVVKKTEKRSLYVTK